MMRIILGLVKVKAGRMKFSVDGNLLDMSPDTRKFIAYVPQGNTMMHGTIAENLRMLRPDASDQMIIDALENACAMDFVRNLPDGINSMVGESGNGFSEGQNQRLSIARALLSDAPILLLDEATSALDVATERKVLKNLMSIGQNRTCILTTHRPSVLPMCNYVYSISNKTVNRLDQEQIDKLTREF